MHVEYAKEKSDFIAKKDGTYIPKEKRKKEMMVEKKVKLNPV